MKTLELLDIMIQDTFALTVLILIGIFILAAICFVGWVFIQEKILDIQTGIREKTYNKPNIITSLFYDRIALHINQKRDKKYFNMFVKEVAAREALNPPLR